MPAPDENFEPAPIRTSTRQVPAEWIDYNGHMNVAYYTLAFDQATDEVLARLGIGEDFVRTARMGPMALQTQIHFLGELMQGDGFWCEFRLLDADPKRIHFFLTMVKAETGTPAAVYESLSINVDLEARRSAPYPDWAQARLGRLLAAQAALPRPELAGRTMAIRRKA